MEHNQWGGRSAPIDESEPYVLYRLDTLDGPQFDCIAEDVEADTVHVIFTDGLADIKTPKFSYVLFSADQLRALADLADEAARLEAEWWDSEAGHEIAALHDGGDKDYRAEISRLRQKYRATIDVRREAFRFDEPEGKK